jgi:uncharacterized membrane protein YuzA (DUF378 family)
MKLTNRDDWSLAHLFSSTLVENFYAVVGLSAVIEITCGCYYRILRTAEK